MKVSTSKKRGPGYLVSLSLVLGSLGIICLTYFSYAESKALTEATNRIQIERLQSSVKIGDMEERLLMLEKTLGSRSITSKNP